MELKLSEIEECFWPSLGGAGLCHSPGRAFTKTELVQNAVCPTLAQTRLGESLLSAPSHKLAWASIARLGEGLSSAQSYKLAWASIARLGDFLRLWLAPNIKKHTKKEKKEESNLGREKGDIFGKEKRGNMLEHSRLRLI